MDQAGKPERRLSEWLQNNRWLERSRNDPFDHPRGSDPLSDPMDHRQRLHHQQDRSLLLVWGQICDQLAARRDRRLLLPLTERLLHVALNRNGHSHQQRLLLRLRRLPFLPNRFPASQARRSLCGRHALERVRRSRERLPAGPDDQPNRRASRQVLTRPITDSRIRDPDSRFALIRELREELIEMDARIAGYDRKIVSGG